MNREIFHPLSIGVIIIWIIMTFVIKIPLFFLVIILALLNTNFNINKNNMTLYLLIIGSSIFIGTLALHRTELEASSLYIPISNKSDITCDVIVRKDSTPVIGGFISTGLAYKTNNTQFQSIAKEHISIFSKEPFFNGQIILNANLQYKNGEWTSTIKNNLSLYSNTFYYFRRNLIEIINNRLSSGLLLALLLGNKSCLSVEQIALFRQSGCSHILALSGFHVGIVSIMFIFLLRLIFTGFKNYYICFFFLVFYLCFTGFTPSLIRSIIMFIVSVILKSKGYRISVFNILILTFLILILIVPKEFFTLSFRLSFAALFGILIFADELSKLPLFMKLPNIIKLSISASISAILCTSFICFPIFGVLYPVGIVASVILTPLVSVYMWLGIFSIFFPILSKIIIFLERVIYFLVNSFSKWPVITYSDKFSFLITLIMVTIPVILVILKIHRRTNARRFNLKFKL